MKYKTTIKEVKNGYHTIIDVGYCNLQSLLEYDEPVAYNAGIYGWNFDVYDIDGVAICTGYRNMPSKNSNTSYDLIHHYETLSKNKSCEEKAALLKEFINKAITKT